MRFNVTPNLIIDDSDKKAIEYVNKFRPNMPERMLQYIDGKYDWAFIGWNEGDMYLIQHFGLEGDEGYGMYILKNLEKNRKDLSALIDILQKSNSYLAQTNRLTKLHKDTLAMVETVKIASSFAELFKNGILHTPPPSLN